MTFGNTKYYEVQVFDRNFDIIYLHRTLHNNNKVENLPTLEN